MPPHLRDAHYSNAERIGHGVGYQYPHDDPRGWVEQNYLPDQLAGAEYYQPSGHGHEADIGERLRRRRGARPEPRSAPTRGPDPTPQDDGHS